MRLYIEHPRGPQCFQNYLGKYYVKENGLLYAQYLNAQGLIK